METHQRLYTTPILNKGKEVKLVPKGSTKAKEQAKLTWYIDFNFYNSSTGMMQRVRKTNNGNRIKDPIEKLDLFTELLASYKELLSGGWDPFNERSNDKLKKSIVSITLKEAKDKFDGYHQTKGTRKKSLQTYTSKLNFFTEYWGADKKVNELGEYEVIQFLNEYERSKKWTGVTYNTARIVLNNFFRFLKINKYIEVNPVTDVETRRELKTELHQVLTPADLTKVLNWLEKHDPYALLFVRMIYYTCIRPKELRYLQLKHIDLLNNTITVPATVAKNKKAMPVHIDPSLRKELVNLTLHDYPEDYYLFGSTDNIVGPHRIGENTPYNRFHKCLLETGLLNKNYTLYSIKHLSNVKKANAGWTIGSISAANRHSSVSETETYIKDLLKIVPTDLIIPPL